MELIRADRSLTIKAFPKAVLIFHLRCHSHIVIYVPYPFSLLTTKECAIAPIAST